MSEGRVITAHTLRDYLTCARRVWLDAHGDPAERGEPPAPVAASYTLGVEHERRVHDATAALLEPVPVASWAEAVEVTRELMARRVPAILGACLEHTAALDLTDRTFTLRGRVDQLRRVSVDGETRYAPVEIKRRSRPIDADWVQLDLYAWLVGELTGTAAPGELWLGADELGRPAVRLPHVYDADRLLALLSEVAQALDPAAPPPVRIRGHCKACPWYAPCAAIARREGRLELLYSVPMKTREALRAAGIASLADVAACSPDDLQRVKGIGPVTAPMIRANAQAWLDGAPVWYNPLPGLCVQSGWMFDLETLRDGTPWCLGWCDEQGRAAIALVAPVSAPEAVTLPDGQPVTLAPDPDAAWRVFAADVASRPGPIYHWTAFDAAVLAHTAPADVRATVGPRMHDLHASIKRCVSFPLSSTSIKAVAAYLGYRWPGYNDWFAAFLDYQEWLATGDVEALTRACTYQRADVESMALVWRWLVNGAGAPSSG